MIGPLHTCDPEDPCPVLSGAPCEGRAWREVSARRWAAREEVAQLLYARAWIDAAHVAEDGGPIYGEGKPGARPCLWPDDEAPFDWDDPPLCRRPAIMAVRFTGAARAIPTCASCLRDLTPVKRCGTFTLEAVE